MFILCFLFAHSLNSSFVWLYRNFRVMWIQPILLISSLIPILWSNTSGHKPLTKAEAGSRIGRDEVFKTRQLWNGRRRGRCKQINQTKKQKVKELHIFYHPKNMYFKIKRILSDRYSTFYNFTCPARNFQFCSTSCGFPTKYATLEMELRVFATQERSAMKRLNP